VQDGVVPSPQLPPKIPLNFFAIPFGLLGLADCWFVAAKFSLAPIAIADVLTAIAALIWLTVLIAYARYARPRPGALVVDLLITATVLLGGFFTGQWIYRPLAFQSMHPELAPAEPAQG